MATNFKEMVDEQPEVHITLDREDPNASRAEIVSFLKYDYFSVGINLILRSNFNANLMLKTTLLKATVNKTYSLI